MGELVFTTLTKEGLPMVRYRTRDLTRLLPGTARTMRRMEKITGRSDDMIILRGVNVFPTQIEEIICQQKGLAPHYLIELTREGNLDHVALTVERTHDFDDHCTEDETLSSLQQHIKSYIGISTKVTLSAVGTLERSLGKAKHVIDRRIAGRG